MNRFHILGIWSLKRLHEMHQPEAKVKRMRQILKPPVLHWITSPWYLIYLCVPEDHYTNQANARGFQNAFRLLWTTFSQVVNMAREKMEYDELARSAVGVLTAPIDLLLLGYLATVGDTLSYVHMFTHLKEQTYRNFSKAFF